MRLCRDDRRNLHGQQGALAEQVPVVVADPHRVGALGGQLGIGDSVAGAGGAGNVIRVEAPLVAERAGAFSDHREGDVAAQVHAETLRLGDNPRRNPDHQQSQVTHGNARAVHDRDLIRPFVAWLALVISSVALVPAATRLPLNSHW